MRKDRKSQYQLKKEELHNINVLARNALSTYLGSPNQIAHLRLCLENIALLTKRY